MTREDVLNEYTGCGWDYPEYENMADEIVRLRAILAALREPTDHIIVSAYDELCLQDHDNARYSLADTIRAAVAAAEREVANEVR